MSIYWEKQQGNNCRIHSLNAFFGKQKITPEIFNYYCGEYDKLVQGLNSRDMDGFAECRSIVSYIIDTLTEKMCFLIPINLNGVSKKHREIWDFNRLISYFGVSVSEYFEFNKDHIWANRYIDGEWYKIDSLSGVTSQNPLKNISDNGYLIVLTNKFLVNTKTFRSMK